jgi:hypothetical protein
MPLALVVALGMVPLVLDEASSNTNVPGAQTTREREGHDARPERAVGAQARPERLPGRLSLLCVFSVRTTGCREKRG